MKGHELLLACALLLSAGPVPADAIRTEDPMGSAVPKVPCSGDPPETGSACPGQTGMDPAETWRDLQGCMAGAANSMQGYRARYRLCLLRSADATRAGRP